MAASFPQLTAGARWVVLPAMVFVLLLAACSAEPVPSATPEPGPPYLDRDSATSIAWEALQPNTRSHDRANWAVVEAQTVLVTFHITDIDF